MGCGSSSIPSSESGKEDNRYVSPSKDSQKLHAISSNNDNNNNCGTVVTTSAVYSDKNDDSQLSTARAVVGGGHSQGHGDIRMDYGDVYFEIFCKCKKYFLTFVVIINN